jgi:hypothetical protein
MCDQGCTPLWCIKHPAGLSRSWGIQIMGYERAGLASLMQHKQHVQARDIIIIIIIHAAAQQPVDPGLHSDMPWVASVQSGHDPTPLLESTQRHAGLLYV